MLLGRQGCAKTARCGIRAHTFAIGALDIVVKNFGMAHQVRTVRMCSRRALLFMFVQPHLMQGTLLNKVLPCSIYTAELMVAN